VTDLAKLVVRLEAETAKYQAELGKAQKKLGNFEKKSSEDLKKLGKQFGQLAGSAATGMGAVVAAVTSGARDIANQARVANAGAEEFQRLAFGARTVGIEQEKLSDILKDVNDRVGDFNATGAGPMADFFEVIAPKVGVTADAFRDLSGPQALQLYFDSLEAANLSQADMTFYLEAMASDTTALIPLLRNGGQEFKNLGDRAERVGAVLSDEAVAASAEFQGNLSLLGSTAGGFSNQLTTAMLPTLVRLSEELVTVTEKGDATDTMVSGLDMAFRVVVGTVTVALASINAVGKALGGVIAIAATIAEKPIDFFIPGRNEEQLTRIGVIAKEMFGDVSGIANGAFDSIIKTFEERGAELEKGAEKTGRSVGRKLLPNAKEMAALVTAQQSALTELTGMAADMQQQLATADMGESALMRYRVQVGDLSRVIAAAGPQGEAYGQMLINLSEDMEMHAAAAKLATDQQAAYDRMMQEGAAIIEATRTPLESYMDTVRRLNELVAEGAIDQQTYNRAVADAQDALDDSKKKADIWAVAMEESGRSAARNVQSELSDILFDPFEDGLKGMLSSFVDIMRRMAAEAAAAGLVNSVIGQGAGALGAYFTGGGGPQMNPGLSIPIDGGRQYGGPVKSGGLYEINEGGVPELLTSGGSQYLMMADESGFVTPLNNGTNTLIDDDASAGNVYLNITNQSSVPIDARQVSSRMGPGNDKTVDMVIRDIGEGGPTARALERTYGLQRRGSF
tara:strand:+ start:20259 stop:22472 length:2214 start_codon:yes stop_codon:yes gene_type:complete